MKFNKLIKTSLAFALIFGSVGILAGCGKDDNSQQVEEKFTVTLNIDGTTQTATVKKGDKFLKPTTEPTKQDYVFSGWYKDSSFETLYDFNSVPTSDFNLYAKFILEYEPISFGEQKSFSQKNVESVTKVEYIHNTEKNATLNVSGNGILSVNIIDKISNNSILNETNNDGDLSIDLNLVQNSTYRMTFTGAVSSILINETVEKELDVAVIDTLYTLEFDEGVSEKRFFAHLTGEYEFTFTQSSDVNVTITDAEDNVVTGDFIIHDYVVDLNENTWYKIKVEYNGTETVTYTPGFNGGHTTFSNDSVISLIPDQNRIYKAIIKPNIGDKILISPFNSYYAMRSIKLYNADREIVISKEDEENGVYLEMEASAEFYYVEVTFDRFNTYYNTIHFVKNISNDLTANDVEKNTAITVEPDDSAIQWYKFESAEEEKYTLSSNTNLILLDEQLNYVTTLSSGSYLELENEEVVYIGIYNNSPSNYTFTIKDSFASASNMSNQSWSDSINKVYKLSPDKTLKYRWTFSAADISITILDEDRNVLASYTSVDNGDIFKRTFNAGTNYYIRITSSSSGNIKFEKQEDPSKITGTHNISDGSYGVLVGVFYGDIVGFEIPTSGYYKFYAQNPNKANPSTGSVNYTEKCDVYLLDSDFFRTENIVAKYDGVTFEHTYQTVYLKAGTIYLVNNAKFTNSAESQVWIGR